MWAQERPLTFERAGYEHDATQPFFKRRHVDSGRTCNLLSPTSKPFGTSGRNTDRPGSEHQFEADPHERISTIGLVP